MTDTFPECEVFQISPAVGQSNYTYAFIKSQMMKAFLRILVWDGSMMQVGKCYGNHITAMGSLSPVISFEKIEDFDSDQAFATS